MTLNNAIIQAEQQANTRRIDQVVYFTNARNIFGQPLYNYCDYTAFYASAIDPDQIILTVEPD